MGAITPTFRIQSAVLARGGTSLRALTGHVTPGVFILAPAGATGAVV
jgi:hypothetical protein